MIAQGLRWTVVGVCCAALVGPAALADDRDRDRDADHPLARSHEGRRGEPERPGESPKVAVIRLEHIPAVSFMETIKQLAQAEEAREHLKRIPLAMNEQANAIVVVGPPEVCEFFERIAEGLDKPSEFHARMRERQMDEARRGMELREQMARRCMELRQEMQKRGMPVGPPSGGRPMAGGPQPGRPGPGAGMMGRPGMGPGAGMMGRPGMGPPCGPCPGCPFGGPGGMQAPRPPRPEGPPAPPSAREPRPPHAERPERPEPPRGERPPMEGEDVVRQMLERGLADPAADLLKRLLDPKTIEKLRLEGAQADKVRQIAKEHFGQMEQLRQRVGHAVKEAEPRERPRVVEEVLRGARQRIGELSREARERIMGVLRPEQREALEGMLRSEEGPPRRPGPPGEPRERPGPPRGGESRRGEREL